MTIIKALCFLWSLGTPDGWIVIKILFFSTCLPCNIQAFSVIQAFSGIQHQFVLHTQCFFGQVNGWSGHLLHPLCRQPAAGHCSRIDDPYHISDGLSIDPISSSNSQEVEPSPTSFTRASTILTSEPTFASLLAQDYPAPGISTTLAGSKK